MTVKALDEIDIDKRYILRPIDDGCFIAFDPDGILPELLIDIGEYKYE